jgi:hypothetical protein
MSNPTEIVNLNTVIFPKFNPNQLEFFAEMIKLTQQDRLRLDPRALSHELFCLQWNSLEAMEGVYKWLIDAHHAIVASEAEERAGKDSYNPQGKVDLAGNQVQEEVQPFNSTF